MTLQLPHFPVLYKFLLFCFALFLIVFSTYAETIVNLFQGLVDNRFLACYCMSCIKIQKMNYSRKERTSNDFKPKHIYGSAAFT